MRAGGFFPEALGDDVTTAVARVQSYNAEWDAMRTLAPPPKAGRVAWLIDEYQKSSWYRALKPRTLEGVDFALGRVRSAFGEWRVADMSRRDVRIWYEKIHDKRGLSTANRCAKILRRLLNFAVELELRKDNPAAALNLRSEGVRRVRWQPEQVGVFIGAALALERPGWALAVAIGYDSSQRLGDVLAALHRDIDGAFLRFEQAKTNEETESLLSQRTRDLIADTPKTAVTIVTGTSGRPITNRVYFNREFRRIRDAAGLPAVLWFKDLRRTAASEALAGGGRAEPLTGHRPGSAIIKHYEVPDRKAVRATEEARRRGRERGE